MKILVVGGGGREMALVHHLAQRHTVLCAGGSDAIAELASVIPLPSPSSDAVATYGTDEAWKLAWQELADTARSNAIDLTIVGPEAPLATGITDVFSREGLPIFAPTQAAARIETSKAYAKQIMDSAGVPTARFQLFDDPQPALDYIKNPTTRFPLVLKENGLRAGKGVTICESKTAAENTLRSLTVDAGNPLIIEDYLEGFEFSLIVMAHGTSYVPLPVAQDHKPIGEGNTGANTGGMGAVSPVPRVTDELYQSALTDVIEPTLAELSRQGNPFTGFLYAGLIATSTGVKVIEFNARLGDPEAEVILPRITSDLAQAAADLLHSDGASVTVSEHTCLGIVLSSPGYPGAVTSHPHVPQALLDAIGKDPAIGITHMGTKREADAWIASGGRVALVYTTADSIRECQSKLLSLLGQNLPDPAPNTLYYRRDIGNYAS
ncbi:MAG: phosphoribosylamine--glycine ligase [Actinomycetaceae bacterium]|nr:phosphoribosylamine--glycine ligase [Arcanobacterium sp.]MDD7504332.1 phosphoribosylamine--glycine ligase [Actinomycetaceae bacterium]MDY6143919.1 phosphoribosylamine--glycine ligase [Arcanobacterium sp.]